MLFILPISGWAGANFYIAGSCFPFYIFIHIYFFRRCDKNLFCEEFYLILFYFNLIIEINFYTFTFKFLLSATV